MDLQKQIYQSLGQFLIVFLTGMALFKTWGEVAQMGVLNAVWQPAIQGLISALGIYGFSKVGRQP